ncbi:unnamed protein product [Urochloa humidicola]
MEELVRMQTQLMQTMTQSIAMMQQNQQNQQNQALVRDKRAEFMKGHPPNFSHASNPLEADDWLKAVERQLNIAQCTDREKVLYASEQLEGAADEDMIPMHTTMIGAWNGVEEVQQGCPSRRGGMRLIRFESQGGGQGRKEIKSNTSWKV